MFVNLTYRWYVKEIMFINIISLWCFGLKYEQDHEKHALERFRLKKRTTPENRVLYKFGA